MNTWLKILSMLLLELKISRMKRFLAIDAISLFTNLPLQKTINIMFKKVYVEKTINTTIKKIIWEKDTCKTQLLFLLMKYRNNFAFFLYNTKPFYCYSYLLKLSIMILTRSQYKNMSKEELFKSWLI